MTDAPDRTQGDATACVELGSAFCWTRYGTESGERIDDILQRKSEELNSSNGVFLWGIGNSVRPSLPALLAQGAEPLVRFSSMLSPARLQDREPPRLRLWQAGRTFDGRAYRVPDEMLVTSNGNVSRLHHFALVCSSATELRESDQPPIDLGALRNLVSGTRVGHSQVTAVVRATRSEAGVMGATYTRGFTARLVAPYFVTLNQFIEVDPRMRADELRRLRSNHAPYAIRRELEDVLPGFGSAF